MIRYLPILLFLLFGTACEQLAGPSTLKLGHSLDTSHPVHKSMVFMANRVAELSEGQLLIEIFPSQQLGTERQCLELLQIGSLDMTKVSASVLENFAPEIKVLSLPYLFRDREHAYQMQDGPIGEELLLSTQAFWIRGLAYLDAGQRSFYTKDRPVTTPADLANLKIRVQESVTAMEMVRKMGASPTPISWGELYTALQQGVVDGAENNPPSFHLSRHYEVCKYYILNEHTNVPDVLAIGTSSWDRLDEQAQKWLQQAAKEAVAYQRTLWQAAEVEALTAVEAAGVTIIRPDKAAFAEQVKDILVGYQREPAIYNWIQRIQAIE